MTTPTDRIRYVIHPGYVISKTDGDRHWIGVAALMKLYGVPLKECVVCERGRPVLVVGATHLWPREDGDYRIPQKDKQ